MADQSYDLVVIGAGPGGYVCAIRAAQLGLKVACVEKRPTLGGTCLNVGCIPSKALLQSSEKYEGVLHDYAEHGIVAGAVTLDLAKMQARKAKVVLDNTKGIEFLFKKNKVTWLRGAGRITGANSLSVTADDGSVISVTAKAIVVATGSDVAPLPGVEIDEKQIVSSTGALELDKVPGTLVVVGAGVIGLELGSVWRRLGAKVTVVEYLDRITPGLDTEIAKQFQRLLEKQGMEFKLSTKVTKAVTGKQGVSLTLEAAAGGVPETIDADVVLVAIGRRPYTDGLGLMEVGVKMDGKGRIETNHDFRSSVPSIFAIGDVIAGPMLAHKAEEEGVAVAEYLAGQTPHLNYDAIPSVVYTAPEIASVGKTEEEVKASGRAYKVGKFPFTANGRAKANGHADGLVKIIADAATDAVLGVHILGHDAGTLIAEAVLAMEYGGSSEDIARTCHAHPTLNEAVKEAALAVDGRALHM